ncbi:MAG: universal stress protein [Desulfobacterales bacterium]
MAKAARCPVMVINRPAASFWGGISNVLFATDFSAAADRAFDFAFALVQELGCNFTCFMHWMSPGTRHAISIPRTDIDDRIREALQRLRVRYVSQMKGYAHYSAEVWEGIPFVEIVKYGREKQADLIVMAHSNRKDESDDDVIGSVAEQVVLRANCPVITINQAAGKH